MYDGHYYDPAIPGRGYVSAGLIPPLPVVVRASPGGNCEKPEITSVDELWTVGAYDYYFAIVWQEPAFALPNNLNIWYEDGTTQTSGPGGMFVALAGAGGQINPVNNVGDSYDPDIAATQDYQGPAPPETYYFHVNWVYNIWGPPAAYQVDTCYAWGAVPTPGAAAFAATASASGPIAAVLDRPTIASKLVAIGPTIFETWMCWERS